MENYNKKELGDYQTPLFFTDTICEYLKEDLKISPDIIIEPTCGIGNFLKSSSKHFPNRKMYGIDIDNEKLKEVDPIANLKLINADIFTLEFGEIDKNNSFLIIGNPPWVTNTELSKINSKNLPQKSNYRGEMAIDAMTGDSNFDISESIILKMIDEFKDSQSTVAFLCKTTVSRNVFIELNRKNTSYSFFKQLNFDAYKIFKIDADACLLIIQLGGKTSIQACEVSDISNPSKILYRFGFKDGRFYSNLEDTPDIDGDCQFEWRQGVKHDCADIMELTCEDGKLVNKIGEIVNIEDSLLYPLLKTSQLKAPIITKTSRKIIITQQKIKQDTTYIKTDAPKTWKYLNDNKDYFDKRKSSIYLNKPDFSIFGIGDYSFKKYKVSVSGFYKNPKFCMVYCEKPVMLDDTCYFLSFDDYDEAYITMLILNSSLVKGFLKNIAFIDSKRPYTKKVLKRIDISKCLKLLTVDDLKKIESDLNIPERVSEEKLSSYRSFILGCE